MAGVEELEPICINDRLRDDELRSVLYKLDTDKGKEVFGLVCKRWLHLQNTDRKKLCARADPQMLSKIAARFTHLIDLDLSQSTSRSCNPVVTDLDVHVIAIGFESTLRILKLQNCKDITDAGMTAIGTYLHSLQSLDVSHCRNISDTGLTAVTKGCNDLRVLHVEGVRHVTDILLESLANNCHNLEELNLFSCNSITDNGLIALVKGCKRMKYLDVTKCIKLEDLGICTIAEAYSTSLKTLKLQDLYKIGDKSLFTVSKFCKNLETLNIQGCKNFSCNSIRSLAGSTQKLKIFKLSSCSNVSDTSLNAILSQCAFLEYLDIGWSEHVTDATFRGLLNVNKGIGLRLKKLKIDNCPKITVLGISMVVKACKSLESLHVRSCIHITKSGCDEAGLIFPESCKVRIQDPNDNRCVIC